MVEWAELGVFCSVIGGLIISLCITIQKSRCDNINICCGLLKCHRKIEGEGEEKKKKEEEIELEEINNV